MGCEKVDLDYSAAQTLKTCVLSSVQDFFVNNSAVTASLVRHRLGNKCILMHLNGNVSLDSNANANANAIFQERIQMQMFWGHTQMQMQMFWLHICKCF